MVDIFACGTHSGARLNLGARVRQRARARVVRRRCCCSKAVAVVAVEYTRKDRNTSLSPCGNGAHMDWTPGSAVAVGCVALCPHLVAEGYMFSAQCDSMRIHSLCACLKISAGRLS